MGYSVSEDSDQSTASAARTGNAALKIGRSAVKAAGGNYIGAAATVLTDKDTRRAETALILLPAFFFVFVLLFVLYIYPMAMYETLQDMFNKATEEFWIAYYADGTGGLHAVLSGIGAWFKPFMQALGDSVTSLFEGSREYRISEADIGVATGSSEVDDNGTSITDIDGTVIVDTKVSNSYLDKLEYTRKKYKEHSRAVLDELMSKGSGAVGAACAADFASKYRTSDPEDGVPDRGGGFSWITEGTVVTQLSYKQAMWYTVLYDLLTDNNFTETTTTDYLKWLGWNDRGTDTMLYPSVLGSADSISVEGWEGTYMPAILCDEAYTAADEKASEAAAEAKAEARKNAGTGRERVMGNKKESPADVYQKTYDEKYREVLNGYKEKYGTSAIDMMLVAYIPYSIYPSESKTHGTVNAGTQVYDGEYASARIDPKYIDYEKRGFEWKLDEEINARFATETNHSTYAKTVTARDILNRYGYYYEEDKAGLNKNDEEEALKIQKGDDLGYITIKSYSEYWDVDYVWEAVSVPASYTAYYGAVNQYYNQYTAYANALRSAWAAAGHSWTGTWTSTDTVYFSYTDYQQVPVYTKMVRFEIGVEKYYYNVSYSVPIYVLPRNAEEMIAISGLLGNDLTETQMSAVKAALLEDADEAVDMFAAETLTDRLSEILKEHGY